jgi:hypothetical protein
MASADFANTQFGVITNASGNPSAQFRVLNSD